MGSKLHYNHAQLEEDFLVLCKFYRAQRARMKQFSPYTSRYSYHDVQSLHSILTAQQLVIDILVRV